MKKMNIILLLGVTFFIFTSFNVSFIHASFNLNDYATDLNERNGYASYESIPISDYTQMEFKINYASLFALRSQSYIAFLDGSQKVVKTIDLMNYTDSQLTNGIVTSLPSNYETADIIISVDAYDQDFFEFISNIDVTLSGDGIPPTITASGVYYASVSSPVSLNQIKATLSANDETDGDLTNLIVNVVDSYTPNSGILGDFSTLWQVTDSSGNKAQTTIIVRVVDIDKPIIHLNGSSNITVECGSTYNDLGASYTDNYDNDLSIISSGSVNTSSLGTYTIYYDVTDHSGNSANTVSRTITVVDTTKPVITINGLDTIILDYEGTYTEEGATFHDNCDGTGVAIATGIVNSNALGTYYITYTYTDSSGNIADSVTRTVIVQDTSNPAIIAHDISISNADQENLSEIISQFFAYDTYSGNITNRLMVSDDTYSGNELVGGVYHIVLYVTDDYDHSTTKSITITVHDEIPPTIAPSSYLVSKEQADTMTQEEIIAHIQNQ